MSKTLKLTLDILIGAAAPVVILKYGTASLGTLNAYLLAALVPVVWVMLDLFVITRRFNFITTYGGLSAVMRGARSNQYSRSRVALKSGGLISACGISSTSASSQSPASIFRSARSGTKA